MTSRLIEECFALEDNIRYSNYEYIKIDKGTTIRVIDPFALNVEDVGRITPSKAALVKIRTPMWGKGNISDYFHIIKV